MSVTLPSGCRTRLPSALPVRALPAASEIMANVMAAFAQFERQLLGQRTKDALAQRKTEGVRLGRARVISPELEEHVTALRAHGLRVWAIAAHLDAEGIATPGGRPWRAPQRCTAFFGGRRRPPRPA